ncbi:hypothetical protein D0962_14500 [Leptolyngbyaceae cyanobacterium CCMR0082]|uniref:Uncharacterized protein n=2 Tax=Adonisia turfae TaxID=2950184 RepID=A0A6M0S686_9CYAN|nr:hypothetical protein [Adonisia turfae]NEZ60720.1 hypothetical protein [Adonisia turfae CCMR0081]NEZ63984.1 hypothetical protein [Adonisia turfae CCMR0082]
MLRLHHFAAIACLQGALLLGNVPVLGQTSDEAVGLPAAITPNLEGIVDLAETDLPLGVGYLSPRRRAGVQADWLSEVELPLYSEPGGDHWGWIWQGWLIPNGQQAFAIGRDASFTMVSVDPLLLAFPVLEAREDGWLQLQYTNGGSAWIHREQLDDRGMELSFYSWADRLAEADIVALRNRNDAQVLRSQPERGRNVLSLVSPSSLIEPLEVKDNWIRVRVTRPANGCEPLAGASEQEGWLQWQNNDGEVLLLPSRDECAG